MQCTCIYPAFSLSLFRDLLLTTKQQHVFDDSMHTDLVFHYLLYAHRSSIIKYWQEVMLSK